MPIRRWQQLEMPRPNALAHRFQHGVFAEHVELTERRSRAAELMNTRQHLAHLYRCLGNDGERLIDRFAAGNKAFNLSTRGSRSPRTI
jgi:hypothetical protein